MIKTRIAIVVIAALATGYWLAFAEYSAKSNALDTIKTVSGWK